MLPISPPALAVEGMAGVVGGVTGAAITAIVRLFELLAESLPWLDALRAPAAQNLPDDCGAASPYDRELWSQLLAAQNLPDDCGAARPALERSYAFSGRARRPQTAARRS